MGAHRPLLEHTHAHTTLRSRSVAAPTNELRNSLQQPRTYGLCLQQLQVIHGQAVERNPGERQQQLHLQHNTLHDLQGNSSTTEG